MSFQNILSMFGSQAPGIAFQPSDMGQLTFHVSNPGFSMPSLNLGFTPAAPIPGLTGSAQPHAAQSSQPSSMGIPLPGVNQNIGGLSQNLAYQARNPFLPQAQTSEVANAPVVPGTPTAQIDPSDLNTSLPDTSGLASLFG